MNKRWIPLIWMVLMLASCQSDIEVIYISFFKKIIGEWKLDGKPVVEKWTFANYEFRGYVAVVSDVDTVVSEELRILENPDGVFYEAVVKDQNQGKAVLFKLKSAEINKIVFENKDHDFPQQITYELTGINTLKATVGGLVNNEPKSIIYDYTRIEKTDQ